MEALISVLIATAVILTITSIVRVLKLSKIEKRMETIEEKTSDLSDTVRRTYLELGNIDAQIKVTRNAVQNIYDSKDGNGPMWKVDALERAVGAVCHGMSANTYALLVDLMTAVEANDIDKLSSVVRSAQHMCRQYESADGKFGG